MRTPEFYLDRPDFMVFAHRGGCGLGPENTLETARRGLACGAFAWELDVGLSKDGVAVVIHDDTLDRTTNARKVLGGLKPHHLNKHTLEEIASLDAGSWWKPPAPDRAAFRARVPTLMQALNFTKDHGWRVNVEIKNLGEKPGHDRIAGLVVKLIREAGMLSKTLVSSFRQDYLLQVRRIEPALATGVLVVNPPSDPAHLLADLKAQSLHPKWKRSGLGHFKELAAQGMIILPWTVNRPRDMSLARRSKMAGVFTDHPDLANKAT